MNLNELMVLTTTGQAVVIALVRKPSGEISVAYSLVSTSAIDENAEVVGPFIWRSICDQIKLGRDPVSS